MSSSTDLLTEAAGEPDRLTRHLLVAAALRLVLSGDPIVVGGLAEDFYTDDRYTPTDLDICSPLGAADARSMRDHGFVQDGRHWVHEASRVAVEFPAERIDGDESRTLLVDVVGGAARLIGVDDLYLDRLRQATMTEREGDISFKGAVSIAARRFEEMDWRYIRSRLTAIRIVEPQTGESMTRLNKKARRAAMRSIVT